jgi:hypothetical protein
MNLTQGSGAVGDGGAYLAVGDPLAETDVHGLFSSA